MKRTLAAVGLGLLLFAGATAVFVYGEVTSLRMEPVTDDVQVIYGLGGNVGVLRTERGAVVVDTMTFRLQGERIRELAEQAGGGPPRVVINTHYHMDHTHGNPAFPVGTPVIATALTRRYLEAFDAGSWEGKAAELLPNETFEDDHELRIGGKTVRSRHLGRGHTGGDLVVLFVEDRVVHTGDLFFNRRYPNIDLEAGGSVREWVDTLDRVLALDFDQVIPGHGPLTDRAGLEAFQAFLRELAEQAGAAAREGRSLEETLASVELTRDEGYEPVSFLGLAGPDRDFVVRRAWEEASGAVKPSPLPPPAGAAAPEGR